MSTCEAVFRMSGIKLNLPYMPACQISMLIYKDKLNKPYCHTKEACMATIVIYHTNSVAMPDTTIEGVYGIATHRR
jgi:hypothetical protein